MKIGIIGSGAFGLALSSILIDNKHDITMWTRSKNNKELLEKNRYSDIFPNYILDKSIIITNDLKECVEEKALIIIVIPVAYIRDISLKIKPYIKYNAKICIASKGIENSTGMFPYQIIKEVLNNHNIAVLSGPSFAKDIINKKPIGFSLASNNKEVNNVFSKILSNNYIKIRTNDDVIGTEICGAIKNVIAISAGILDGLNVGHSTRAMLITEAIHDIENIIEVFNGNKKTVLSYAGFGDLLLTCTSNNSRNYQYGKLIGEGKNKEALEEFLSINTVEGYFTLESIYKLLQNKKVEIPIIDLIYNIVNNTCKVDDLLSFLIAKE